MSSQAAPESPRSEAMPLWLIAAAFVGALGALFGGYWDDAWHTERGRDSFFILPHILIYAGIAGIGAMLTIWIADLSRRIGLREALSRPTVRLAAISVAATLASGPIDDVWHRAFGRDAVFWSPPHMLGIVGTIVLGAALLAESARRPRVWSILAGGLVLSAAGFIVAEYDTDVPQFDALWYLPVLAVAASVAFGLVKTTIERRWAASETAIAQLAFVVLVAGFLATQDFGPPALHLLIVPALALDWAWARGWSSAGRTLAFVAALFGAYVPTRNWLGSGIELDALDVLLGLPLAYAGAYPFIALAGGARPALPNAKAGAATAALALSLVLPAAALGHDPGQGDDAGAARLTVESARSSISAAGSLNRRSCTNLRPGRLVARRAGVEETAPLRLAGCRFAGRVQVEGRGRWFVYAELHEAGRRIEVWLPVHVGLGGERVSDDERFAYVPPGRSTKAGELIGGAVLYAGMLALLISALVLLRPARPARLHPSTRPG